MKNLILIAMCLMALGARGQYYSDATIQKWRQEKRENDSVLALNRLKHRHDDSIRNAISKKEEDADELKMRKKYGAKTIQRVIAGEVWVGISDELCLYGLTEPNSRKTTYTKDGKTETWIYNGQASGCIGSGCPWLDYIITFKNHKAIAVTTGE